MPSVAVRLHLPEDEPAAAQRASQPHAPRRADRLGSAVRAALTGARRRRRRANRDETGTQRGAGWGDRGEGFGGDRCSPRRTTRWARRGGRLAGLLRPPGRRAAVRAAARRRRRIARRRGRPPVRPARARIRRAHRRVAGLLRQPGGVASLLRRAGPAPARVAPQPGYPAAPAPGGGYQPAGVSAGHAVTPLPPPNVTLQKNPADRRFQTNRGRLLRAPGATRRPPARRPRLRPR